MLKYEIEQFEIYVSKYRVEANSEAEAIQKLFDGEHEPIDDSLEYVEVAEDIGLPVDENRELADELRALGVSVGEDVIPSIRSIEEVDEARGCEGHIRSEWRPALKIEKRNNFGQKPIG